MKDIKKNYNDYEIATCHMNVTFVWCKYDDAESKSYSADLPKAKTEQESYHVDNEQLINRLDTHGWNNYYNVSLSYIVLHKVFDYIIIIFIQLLHHSNVYIKILYLFI